MQQQYTQGRPSVSNTSYRPQPTAPQYQAPQYQAPQYQAGRVQSNTSFVSLNPGVNPLQQMNNPHNNQYAGLNPFQQQNMQIAADNVFAGSNSASGVGHGHIDENNINPYCSTPSNIVPYTFPYQGKAIKRKANTVHDTKETNTSRSHSRSCDLSDDAEIEVIEVDKQIPTMMESQVYHPSPNDQYLRVQAYENVPFEMTAPYEIRQVRTWCGRPQVFTADGMPYVEVDTEASTAYDTTDFTSFSDDCSRQVRQRGVSSIGKSGKRRKGEQRIRKENTPLNKLICETLKKDKGLLLKDIEGQDAQLRLGAAIHRQDKKTLHKYEKSDAKFVLMPVYGLSSMESSTTKAN